MFGLGWQDGAAILAVLAFNVPVGLAAYNALSIPDLKGQVGKLLKEKDSAGDPTDGTSYSRVTGAIGAVMVGTLFWIFSNIAVVVAIEHPADLASIMTAAGKLFLVGAALFLPYVFNQLKSVLQ